jgi:hypothetical protein
MAELDPPAGPKPFGAAKARPSIFFDLVIPGCALLGADPESSTVHCGGFRVRAKTRAPE